MEKSVQTGEPKKEEKILSKKKIKKLKKIKITNKNIILKPSIFL